MHVFLTRPMLHALTALLVELKAEKRKEGAWFADKVNQHHAIPFHGISKGSKSWKRAYNSDSESWAPRAWWVMCLIA